VAIPVFNHVVFVAEENHGFGQIIGSSSAPYINGTLVPGGALFTGFHAIGHPSFPNYIAMFCGSVLNPGTDNCPPPGSPYNVPNLYSSIAGVGKTFGGYMQSWPGTPTACGPSPYLGRHVFHPWFTGVPAAVSHNFTAFPQTAAGWAALPTISFVSPDVDHDMHSSSIAGDVVRRGDDWLAANLDGYAQWAKLNNSLLIVWWDEDFGSADNPPLIFYGANVKPGRYGESINHYNILRTLVDMYGGARPGNAATAVPITDVWTTGGPPPPQQLTITTTTLPAATAGVAYTTTLAFTGGTPPVTWSETGGLPAGMTLTAAGVLSGTPPNGGTFPITARLADSGIPVQTAQQPLTLTVGTGPPPPPTLTITTPALPAAQTGTPYQVQLAASGGTGTLTWTETGALPAGFTLTTAGLLAGTATTAGTFPLTIKAADGAGHTAAVQFNLTVAATPPPPPPPVGTVVAMGGGVAAGFIPCDGFADTFVDIFGRCQPGGPPPPQPNPWTQIADAGPQTGWGGIVFINPAGMTRIACTFTIPALTGSTGALCSVWVGIGNVQQTGLYTAYDVTKPGNCHASPWTWYLPAAEIWDEVTYPYKAGDSVTLSLSYDQDYWHITQANNSQGWSFTEQKSVQAANIGGRSGSGEYLFPPDRAEIIIEKAGAQDLPAYGTLTFTNIQLTPSGGQWQRVVTINGGVTDQEPSLFTGTEFTMAWEAAH